MDFLVTGKDNTRTLVEVKGCTLTVDGVALFPDAPTERGTRHLETLMQQGREGMRTAVIILIFRKDSTCFRPNVATDPKFAETFGRAMKAGIEIHPLVLSYEEGKILYHHPIPVCFP